MDQLWNFVQQLNPTHPTHKIQTAAHGRMATPNTEPNKAYSSKNAREGGAICNDVNAIA